MNIDRGGRILNVTGAPVPDLSVPSVDPELSAAAAMARSRQRRRQARDGREIRRPRRRHDDDVRHGDFARLVLFDGPGGLRLAWHLIYRANSLALYDAVVDATTGNVLFRQNLTKFDGGPRMSPGTTRGRT